MDKSPNLQLPYIAAAQAQKHVTHNEAIRRLDAIVQLSVLDRNLTTPPANPDEGDRYIVAVGATGEWLGKEHQIAAWQDGLWIYFPPRNGWVSWLDDEAKLVAWDGTAWNTTGGGGGGTVNPVDMVGINATAALDNRLFVKSDTTTFSHDDVTPGTGDIQHKLNKSSLNNTASFLFQNNWSGRAEIGLTGDDDFHFKTSPDGLIWNDALIIDAASGAVGFPGNIVNNNLIINSDFNINQRAFAGGNLGAGSFGHDRWKAGVSGVDYSVDASGVVTLNSGELIQVIETPDLANRAVCISVSDLSGGDLNIEIDGNGSTITAGSGRRSTRIDLTGGATGNIEIKLSPTTGSVSFSKIKFEPGFVASQWFPVDPTIERLKSMRYYYHMNIAAFDEMFMGRCHSSTQVRTKITLPCAMRAAPSINWGGDYLHWGVYAGGTYKFVSGLSFFQSTKSDVILTLNTPTLPTLNAAAIRQASALSSYLTFAAEL